MKTLINKKNPQIRITAPDITLENHCYYIWTDDGDCIIEFWEKDWTLVEEEQQEEICSKCVYHKKDDGYCYNPYGGMKRRINENGVYECTAFWEREQKEQKPEVDLDLDKTAEKYTQQGQTFESVWHKEECQRIIDEGQGLTPRFKNLFKEVCKAFYEAGAEWVIKQLNKK